MLLGDTFPPRGMCTSVLLVIPSLPSKRSAKYPPRVEKEHDSKDR
jgi:hypothetical protein